MKIDVSKIKARHPAAMTLLMNAVKKSAHAGCRKVCAEEIEDDVMQEVFMIFITDIINRFDPEYNVEPILIETSRRVALSMMRRRREVLPGNEDNLLDDLINDINTSNSNDDDLPVSVSEQQKALEAIKMNFPGIASGEVRKDRGDPLTIVKRRGKGDPNRPLSKQNSRLRDIRSQLGLSQEGFAARLNIHTATLQSYEYGRTAVAPQSVIDTAEEVFKQEKEMIQKNLSNDDHSMKEIVSQWADALRIPREDITTIAEVIGVSKSTVHRWIHDGMRPRPRELTGYMRTVKRSVARIEASDKAIAKIY